MRTNCVVFGWNRAVPGRELACSQFFQSFSEYLGAQKRSGNIDSFDVVFFEPRGNAINGFVIVSGDPAKLQQVTESKELLVQQTKCLHNLKASRCCTA